MRLTTTSLLTAALILSASTAHAASISYNVADPSSSPTVIPGSSMPYGVVASSNWTQTNVDTLNLIDDSGAATTLDLDLASFSLSNFSGVIVGDATTYDYGDSAFAAGDTWTLSDIPYAEYYLIVYVTGNNLGEGTITAAGETFYWNDPANKSTAAQSFVEVTDAGPAGTPVFGNYVVFGSEANPLTAGNQTIAWSAIGGGAAILNGFQVVEVIPEPGSLALMGIGGLLIARRRRG